MVSAGRHCVARALATARSIEAAEIAVHLVMLVTDPIADVFSEFGVLRIDEVLPVGSIAGETLTDEDLLAFAEPFALESLVAGYGDVVSITAGAIVMGGLGHLRAVLVDRSFVLTVPAVRSPADAGLPRLTLREPDAPISQVALAARRGDLASLRAWQETMVEALFDANLEAPHSFRELVLVSQMGEPSVAIEGRGTVINWAAWAELQSRGDPAIEVPPVVDAEELWDILGSSEERVGGDMTETEYRLVDLRIHDAEPLQPLLDIMETALSDAGESPEVTPYERLTRDIRRACDPNGIKWRAGATAEFEDWLFETDDRGRTRIADLYWYADRAMHKRFPDARVDPSRYLKWCSEDGPRELGFHLLDRTVVPGVPDPDSGESEPRGLKNALAWRWNVLKGLVPGVAAAGERREKGLDAVSGPQAGRGIAPPEPIEVQREPMLWGHKPRSLNIIGCLRSESGLGQAARASLAAIRSMEIPFTYIDTSEKYPSRNAAETGLDRSNFGALGDVNLIHANALELIKMNDTVFRHRLGGRFNAAMWFWEAGNLPAWKLASFDRIDELWVASSYLTDVLGQFGKVPVHNIGLAAPLPRLRKAERADLGLRDDEFVFLFVYDALSSHGRKNPSLTMRAFIEAFGPRYDGVRLVIKASNLNKLPVDRERLKKLAATTDAITIIDRYLDHEAVYDLMAAADAYVSLHAAEGYGLTILESMSLATPAICTGYSGNMDFTTESNSWLVDYELIRTEEISGPYPAGSIWARPDMESAVEAMRRAASDRNEVDRKAATAHDDARDAASLERYAAKLGEQLRRVL